MEKRAKHIMIQGTSSNVGKSLLTAALCRIFHQDGWKVAPFKAQNMALNSFVTISGGEIGRATAVQAEAAGVEPTVDMNPILLKPTGNACSQVIVQGKAIGNLSAREYHEQYGLKAFVKVAESLNRLEAEYDLLVIEGAGSPAEVNLKANDIVNMRIARHTKSPVLLVADIDRGGALASVVGTLELLDEEERDLVAGIIINKFRGDIKLLEPALTFLEEKTGKPVLGVIPHLGDHGIEEEDSVVLDEKQKTAQAGEIDIVVLRTPRISNFTDFLALSLEEDVRVRYVDRPEDLGNPDLLILPGSKNTIEDLLYLRQSGLEAKILALHGRGTPVIGICGGYQMLGERIEDPLGVESDRKEVSGLGLLPLVTTFAAEKVTQQATASCVNQKFLDQSISLEGLVGYEIHMGETKISEEITNAFYIVRQNGQSEPDGAISADGTVMGTYLHGVFDHDNYRNKIIKSLRRKKGMLKKDEKENNFVTKKQQNYDKLANMVRSNLDIKAILKIVEAGK